MELEQHRLLPSAERRRGMGAIVVVLAVTEGLVEGCAEGRELCIRRMGLKSYGHLLLCSRRYDQENN